MCILYNREIQLLYIKICVCTMLKYYINTVFISNLVFLNYYYFSITDSYLNPYHILSYLYLLIIILSYTHPHLHTYLSDILYQGLDNIIIIFKKPPLIRTAIRSGVRIFYMPTYGVLMASNSPSVILWS